MRAILSRLFLLLPGWWMFFFDDRDPGVQKWTASGMVTASVIWYCILWAWDTTRRRPRCPISVILARILLVAWVLSLVFLWILPFESAWRFGLILATMLTTAYVVLHLAIHAFGHFFIYPHDPNGNYYEVRAAGWHPFWDRLPHFLNPDSEVIRNGGFEEPPYADFVPPRNWKYQCPRCGAAQPEAWGVCWYPGCGYGLDGDSTDYLKRYGDGDGR